MPIPQPRTGQVRRRFPSMSELDSANAVKMIGTRSAACWHVLISSPLQHMHALVLLAMAHHADVLEDLGKALIIYPEDVADMLGIAANRAAKLMREIGRETDLVVGTQAAGYTLGEWAI